MGIRKRKGTCGEATRYITRNKACHFLQIRLQEFRRLCILKGIYPREPKSRKKAQKGDTRIKTLYLKKDIIYLSHEPIIWKLREEKIYRRKLKSLIGKREEKAAEKFKKLKKPTYKVDHILLERYPHFRKALQDLDDPISTCFLYANMPNFVAVNQHLVDQSRKLTVEFMNYVIEARALRKAFISIKGYYYRAHVYGEKITWMVPHPFPPEKTRGSDLEIMKVFMEFYCTMLGFVNYKLYQSLNLSYPPKLTLEKEEDIGSSKKKPHQHLQDNSYALEALNKPLVRNFIDKGEEDDYDPKLLQAKSDKHLKLAQDELKKVKLQTCLFEGVKFYLGRETNRESLTFIIRSCGGLVSWDSTLGPGATYTEDDKNIKYQIVDRPQVEKKHLSRYYLQPQWVYDSFNAGILLPVQNYFVGVELPAHLSPFEETYDKLYTPPELEKLRALQAQISTMTDDQEEQEDDQEDEEEREEREKKEIEKEKAQIEKLKESNNRNVSSTVSGEDCLSMMKVLPSKPVIKNPEIEKSVKEKEDFQLAASFVHQKQKRLFKKILKREKQEEAQGALMKKKRILYEMELQRRKKKSKI